MRLLYALIRVCVFIGRWLTWPLWAPAACVLGRFRGRRGGVLPWRALFIDREDDGLVRVREADMPPALVLPDNYMVNGVRYELARGNSNLPVYLSSPWLDDAIEDVPPSEYWGYMTSDVIRSLLTFRADITRVFRIVSLVMVVASVPVGVFAGLIVGVQMVENLGG